MFEWTVNALLVTCDNLKKWYGEETCSVGFTNGEGLPVKPAVISKKVSVVEMKTVLFVFEPKEKRRAGVDAPCPCDNVDG